MKKIASITALALILATTLTAQSNLQKNPEGMKKLAQMAGEKSPYYRAKKEVFPKDYFLVNHNLPFLVGTALFHPQSDRLKLTKEQLDKFVEMKKTIVPVSAKMAKEVKTMELELAKAILDENKTLDTLAELVDEIAKTKADMTKAHLKCIDTVKHLLSPEQFKILLELASKKSSKTKTATNPEAKNLFQAKCASCHAIAKPTDMSKLVAPVIMGVMRHVKMSYSDRDKAITFMKDYILNPTQEKAICMPQKIRRFGLMPSQKGVVTEAELDIMLPWIYDNFPPKGFRGMGHGKGMMNR